MAGEHAAGLKGQVRCHRSKSRSKHGGVGFQHNQRGVWDPTFTYTHIYIFTLTDMGTHDKRVGCMCTQSDII